MILYNQTKKSIVSKDLKEAKSLLDKVIGLLNKNNSRSLLFKTHFGIHTFFLTNSIDVIVLDNKFNVVKTASIKPNRLFVYNIGYKNVLELPTGTLKASKTEVGDKLKIE